jgi:hypothetical protein
MSAEKPLETKTSVPPAAGAGYRTLTPGGAQPKKPAAAEQPASAPGKTATAAPKPEPAKPESAASDAAKESSHSDPTRFGDWEVKGRCIDF